MDGYHFKLYRDKAGFIRWNKKSGDDIIADSGEGYSNFIDALDIVADDLREGDTIIVPPEFLETARLVLEDDLLVKDYTLVEDDS